MYLDVYAMFRGTFGNFKMMCGNTVSIYSSSSMLLYTMHSTQLHIQVHMFS